MGIQALIHNPEQETFLAESGWLDGLDPTEQAKLHARFCSEFDKWFERFKAALGNSYITNESDPDLAEQLYYEAGKLAAWRKGDGYLVLAYGQHDSDTPIFVSFGYREPV